MQNGSLTIGDTLLNYGHGSSWNSNMAGLLLECLDNTEIAVHDAGNCVSSIIQYQGGTTSMITIGRDMFWGTPPVTLPGNSLIFPDVLSDYKIKLWTGFGIGIQASELKYTSGGNHNFYKGTTRVVSIDGSGNLTCNGALSVCSTSVLNGTTCIAGKMEIITLVHYMI